MVLALPVNKIKEKEENSQSRELKGKGGFNICRQVSVCSSTKQIYSYHCQLSLLFKMKRLSCGANENRAQLKTEVVTGNKWGMMHKNLYTPSGRQWSVEENFRRTTNQPLFQSILYLRSGNLLGNNGRRSEHLVKKVAMERSISPGCKIRRITSIPNATSV